MGQGGWRHRKDGYKRRERLGNSKEETLPFSHFKGSLLTHTLVIVFIRSPSLFSSLIFRFSHTRLKTPRGLYSLLVSYIRHGDYPVLQTVKYFEPGLMGFMSNLYFFFFHLLLTGKIVFVGRGFVDSKYYQCVTEKGRSVRCPFFSLISVESWSRS